MYILIIGPYSLMSKGTTATLFNLHSALFKLFLMKQSLAYLFGCGLS